MRFYTTSPKAVETQNVGELLEVFQRIVAVADKEVTARSRELLFSGIAAGFAITITFLLCASLYGLD